MKKILSLVLAVAMLSTTAFAVDLSAAGATTVQPGKTITVARTNFGNNLDSKLTLTGDELNSSNFTITKKTFSKGSALVESIGFNDDDGNIEIKLKKNYELFAPKQGVGGKPANLILDELIVSAKKALKVAGAKTNTIARSEKFNYVALNKSAWVGFEINKVDIINGSVSMNSGELIELTDKGDSYGDLSMNEGDVTIEGRVYKGDKVYLEVNNTVGKDQRIVLMANENADLRFYNVITSGLPSNHNILLYVEEDQFIYEIDGNTLRKSNLTWNADEYAFKGKIRSDKQYVVSDIELKAATGTAGSENPDTGANDVVGVAAALAVVSLVAAGAVSLKK